MAPPLSTSCPDDVLSVLRYLRQAGHDAFLVGGCVRDHLLGIPPKDWDIVTDAVPDQVEALFPRTVPIGKAFGVILVVGNEREYEVATFRGDGEYHDGRRPESVHFSSAEEDARRRDFTINALMYDPFEDRVIDYVDGRADLAAGVIRAVGVPEQRFREDALRLLRAVRFAARTGFRLEPATAAAVEGLAGTINRVSCERVGDEIRRMLSEGSARPSLELLRGTGLLTCVLPEVAAMGGVPQPPQFHPEGDVLTHTLLMLGHLDKTVSRSLACAGAADPERDDLCCGGIAEAKQRFLVRPESAGGLVIHDGHDREALAWAVLLHDVGKPDTLTFADRIRFNGHDAKGREIAEAVLARCRQRVKTAGLASELISGHMRFAHIQRMREAKRRRFLQNPAFPLHLELHRLDCVGSHQDFAHFDFALEAWHEEAMRPVPPAPLLTGRDLLEMGYGAGPRMGEILRAVEDARLEGAIADSATAKAWVKARYDVQA
ncbi:MAG: HD domain-containing protein [Lentisphaerae bacterium]|jgi:tRNA nucleotidyltransferase/poly(A) polymerase|nr:HD domain-containing protein [Lentisphaerota bacterium]MBT4821612.1 HD domain-containing protein [Lentisphaerota bacterium]MBT5608156.1 HD domain-containing protein [Lentisphaerota bacterium]MBT7058704.1 HD domain-containing protein [Lentisphaerota bacterium]MBT7847666.1 HD domain-containing protein [Lentisphaerota bacterium]